MHCFQNYFFFFKGKKPKLSRRHNGPFEWEDFNLFISLFLLSFDLFCFKLVYYQIWQVVLLKPKGFWLFNNLVMDLQTDFCWRENNSSILSALSPLAIVIFWVRICRAAGWLALSPATRCHLLLWHWPSCLLSQHQQGKQLRSVAEFCTSMQLFPGVQKLQYVDVLLIILFCVKL